MLPSAVPSSRRACRPSSYQGQLTAVQKVERLITNMPAIALACRQSGPFVYRVHPERIEQLQIPET